MGPGLGTSRVKCSDPKSRQSSHGSLAQSQAPVELGMWGLPLGRRGPPASYQWVVGNSP